MKRLIVVGAGISGTAAAFTATREAAARGLALEVRVLEKDTEVGGKARSIRHDDWLVETGPLGFMSGEQAVHELAGAVGLSSELVPAEDASSRRYVWAGGAMRSVSPHPLRFAASRILGVGGLLRMAFEPAIPKRSENVDESVWEFARRRLGSQFADRLVHPMALGVFAGDAKALSLRSAFPLMAELERDYGSLIRAQIARAGMRRRRELPQLPRLCSFENGIQSLPIALARHGRFPLETGAAVETMAPKPKRGFQLWLRGRRESIVADAVILACDGAAMGTLASSFDSELGAAIEGISSPPVSVVALGFGRDLVRPVPPGFGVLIPRGRGYRALGVTWDSDLFRKRSGAGRVLVRVLFGGAFDPGINELDPDELTSIARREVARLFASEAEPVFTRVQCWPHAIPQYEVGHRDRVRRIERRLEQFPTLHLAGNALYGTSFGKAAARGVQCGKAAIRDLAVAS